MSEKVVFACAFIAALSLLVQRAVAQDPPPIHRGPWPIHNGFNQQPTQDELRALHQQDVTPDQAREIDRLYDQLLSDSEKILRQHPATGILTGTRIGISPKKSALAAGSDAIVTRRERRKANLH